MAEFKTAEQYVVEKVEMLEAELEKVNAEHQVEVSKLKKDLEVALANYHRVCAILNSLRDMLDVRTDDYWGGIIDFDTMYRKRDTEAFDAILDYFDIFLADEEDEDE